MRIAKEQYERDSQLAESKHAAELLDLDTKNMNKLNEQEQAFDKEKISLEKNRQDLANMLQQALA